MELMSEILMWVAVVSLGLVLFGVACWFTVQVMSAALGAWYDRPRGGRIRRSR